MSAGRISITLFATALLNEMNKNHFFDSLDTLPAVKKNTKDKSMSSTIDTNNKVNDNPLVLIESQITLLRIKKELERLAQSKSDARFEKQTLLPLQEILNRRFTSRLSTGSRAYFYGAPIVFAANQACICVAKKLDEYLSNNQEIYAHRLIPCLNQQLSDNFSFANHQIMVTQYDEEQKVKEVKLVAADSLPPDYLSNEDEAKLYDIDYSTLEDIPELVAYLHELIPHNTWRLYLSCLDTCHLLVLATSTIIKIKNSKSDVKTKMVEVKDMTNEQFDELEKNIQTLLDDPIKHSADLLEIRDTILNEYLNEPIASNEKPNASVTINGFREKDDDWNRTVAFVLISLYSRIRELLPDYLRSSTWVTGDSKATKLKETDVLLEFLASNEPLSTMDQWLQTKHAAVKYHLSSSIFSSVISYAVNTNGKLDDIYAKIKVVADHPVQEKTAASGWFSWG